jgi:hypothetical protein
MYLKAKTAYNLERGEYKIIFCVRECLVISNFTWILCCIPKKSGIASLWANHFATIHPTQIHPSWINYTDAPKGQN